MNGPAGFDNLIGRRRGENFTQRAGIDATFTDEPGKRRLMAAAAAADDNGLAGLRHRAINRAVLREGVDPSAPGVHQPFHDFAADIIGVVEQLFGFLHRHSLS